ncbi:MAG TPA: glycoside hydrolase family 99-like domain-containing protein [Parafilimonas sp.]|nr:glycoside hydrolase family 99-like domain-containing protein [Parafilimonas sp.]
MNIKFVPFYFPQFHAIPENDNWWGEGFTDWNWVKEAKPLFKDHYQPRIPANGYYDLRNADVISTQISLAKDYNIYGFNFYHYWFDGKLMLETPLENFIEENKDLAFCVTWANETWTRRWLGKVNDVLIEQKHSANKQVWNKHLAYLQRLFTNENYIRINNRPVFVIYRPDLISNMKALMDYYNESTMQKIGHRIYWIGAKAYESLNNQWEKLVDGILRFEPRYSMNTIHNGNVVLHNVDKVLRSLPERLQIPLGELKAKLSTLYTVYDYRKTCEAILKKNKQTIQHKHKIYQAAFVGWDNTPRYGKRSKIFARSNPENFRYLISNLIEQESAKGNEFLFINAWNEWSESAYLEPDNVYGDAYLSVLKSLS